MEIKRCRDENVFNKGFMDPLVVNAKMLRDNRAETDAYVFNSMMAQNTKSTILLPYQQE